jgi:hypothetical protein
LVATTDVDRGEVALTAGQRIADERPDHAEQRTDDDRRDDHAEDPLVGEQREDQADEEPQQDARDQPAEGDPSGGEPAGDPLDRLRSVPTIMQFWTGNSLSERKSTASARRRSRRTPPATGDSSLSGEATLRGAPDAMLTRPVCQGRDASALQVELVERVLEGRW